MTTRILTQEELKEQLHYDHETGVFTWLVRSSKRIKVGCIAGSLDKIRGYIKISINGERHYAHRLAFLYMEGEFPPEDIDHANGIKNDNSWLNIRHASRTENNMNAVKPKHNTSGFKGVSFHKQTGMYRAYCTIRGWQVHLGLYNTPELAYEARTSYAKSQHGQFYRG